MSIYKSLFKQTAIYGLATVLPRLISFLLNPLYVDVLPKSEFADVSIIFAWLIFFNVILSYGMETSFFRFYNEDGIDKNKVITTSTISIFCSSILFLATCLLSKNYIAQALGFKVEYIIFTIWILFLDALVIIPFSKLRAEKKSQKYAVIKLANVLINFGLNLFFLLILPKIANNSIDSVFNLIYLPNFEIGYIFLSSLLSSFLTFLFLSPFYIKLKWHFDKIIWKKMIQYGFPILIAGLAFAINEHFDKILLEFLNVDKEDIGAYSACYKIGMFMVLFRTAYTLGIEPFFFSYAKEKNAAETYATITKYFIIFGSFMSLFIIVFLDILKRPIVPKASYWEAVEVVPLIIFANFFLGIYTNLSVWYKLINKTKIGAYISIIGALVTLVVNFALIPLISYYGSAIATILAYGTMMTISYKLGQKEYPIPYEKMIISKYIGISILLSGLSFYVPIFRKTYIFGILAILFLTYFIYKNEKETILKIIKRK